MQILHEHQVNADISLLNQAWQTKELFVFLPEKTVVDIDWLKTTMRSLPASLQTNHFGLLTSGSTGLPKLIIGQRSRAEQLVHCLHQEQDSEPVKQTIVTLPLTYSYAFINQWLWSRVHHRDLVLTQGFAEPDRLREQLLKSKDTMLCLVGGQVPLLRQYFDDHQFPGITRIHFAGGRFPQKQLGYVERIFPNAVIYNNYGCAEAMPRLCLRKASAANQADNIGYPLPHIDMRSDNQQRIMFRSPYGSVGFVEGNKFHPIVPDEWVPTGDLGRINADGSWMLLGRANEVFNRYGEKISIAQLLSTVVNVYWNGEAAFYKTRDKSDEDACVLVLSPAPDKERLRSILKGFRQHYSRAHWPLRIESMEQLPYLPNGKFDIRSLANIPNKTEHWRQRI